jgi:hypothetical protein
VVLSPASAGHWDGPRLEWGSDRSTSSTSGRHRLRGYTPVNSRSSGLELRREVQVWAQIWGSLMCRCAVNEDNGTGGVGMGCRPEIAFGKL